MIAKPIRHPAEETLLSDQLYRRRYSEQSSHWGNPSMVTTEAAWPSIVQFGEHEFTFKPAPEQWVQPLLNRICELGSLPRNWNSYGAQPIQPEVAATAMVLLLNLLSPNDPFPSVVPTTRGGILLEWHVGGIDLEIDIRSPAWSHLAWEADGKCEEIDRASMDAIAKKLDQLRSQLK